MGKPSMSPPGPITLQTVEGREAARRVLGPWFRQVSQPKLLTLFEGALKDRVFHSSQCSGLSKGTLLEPTPKVFLAIGRVNQLMAEGKLPAALKHIWEEMRPMVDATGKALGPAELFLIFVGELDPGLPEGREIPQEKEREVSKVFGKFVRTRLAARGVDFVVDDHQRLVELCPSFKPLLSGKEVRGDVLTTDLPVIAEELGLEVSELWDVIEPALET